MGKRKKDFGIKDLVLPLKDGSYYDNVAVSTVQINEDVTLDPVRKDDYLLDIKKARPILSGNGLELYRLAARYAIYSELVGLRHSKDYIYKFNRLDCGITRIAEHILHGKTERLVISYGCDLSRFLKDTFPSTHVIWHYVDILKWHDGQRKIWNKKQADIDAGIISE